MRQKNCQNRSQNQKGFTIVELLIVVLLVGILSTILIVTIDAGRQRDYANDGVRRQNLMDMAQALETYYVAERSYPTSGADKSPLTGTDGSVVSQYIANVDEWGTGTGGLYIYNVDAGSKFSIHVQMGSSTNFFKYRSTQKKIEECTSVDINVVDTCTAP